MTEREIAEIGYLKSMPQADQRFAEARQAYSETAECVPRCRLYLQLATGLVQRGQATAQTAGRWATLGVAA